MSAWESPRTGAGTETGAGFGWSNAINPPHWQAARFSINFHSDEADFSEKKKKTSLYFFSLFFYSVREACNHQEIESNSSSGILGHGKCISNLLADRLVIHVALQVVNSNISRKSIF